jgi:hypothetical protein
MHRPFAFVTSPRRAAPSPRSRGRARALAVSCAIVAVTSAPAQEVDVGVLPGLIVEERDLPTDALGQPQLDAVPGARPHQPIGEEVERRVRELSARRDAIGAMAPSGAAPALIAPPSGENAAPARRDSGDRDPDRLRSAAPLPRSR